jgi:GNAT superfamily N-acetyltransferase
VRIAAMANALNLFEGKPSCPLTAAAVRRLGFGKRATFSIVVAAIAGRAEGYALFYPGYDVESAAPGFHLADLLVEESYRRQGLGRALIVALAAECKRRGGRWIEWHAMVDNPAAATFYERIGAKRAELWTFHLEGKALSRFR